VSIAMLTPFQITANLATPLILSDDTYLTLDALLSGVIFEKTDSFDRALNEIPLDRSNGVWHGSAAFLDSCAIRTSAPFGAGLRTRDVDSGALERLALARIRAGKRRGEIAKIDTQRSFYQSTLVHYSAYSTPRVYWFGSGDMEKVKLLISSVPAIGKKRRQGYGQVEHIEIEPLENDVSLSRFVRGERQPMRPIGLKEWQALYGTSDIASLGCTRCSPPYFNGEARMCAIPPAREVFWRKFDQRFFL